MINNTTLKTSAIAFAFVLLTGCKDYIQQSSALTAINWQPLITLSFICILLTPILSLLLFGFSFFKHLKFKTNLQRFLHGSLVLMLALAWLIELNTTNSAQSRFNLVSTLIALTVQMSVVLFAFISLNKQQKLHNRAKNFL